MPVPAHIQASVEKLIAEDKLQEAEALCQKLAPENPDDTFINHALGVISYMRQNYDVAIEKFKFCLTKINDNVNIYTNLAESLRRKGQFQEALSYFQEALLIDPSFPKANLGIANTLISLKRYQQARTRFQFLIKLYPNFAPAYHYLAVMLSSQDQSKEAIPLLRKAIALQTDYYDAKFSLANALEQNGQPEEARDIYEQLLKERPNDPAAHNNLANLLRSLGYLEEAEEHLKEAVKYNPNHISAYYNRSSKSLAEELTSDDIQRLEGLLSKSNIPEEEMISLHFALAKYYDSQKNYEQAFHHYSEGNAIDKRREPYNPQQQEQVFSILKRFFNRDFFATKPHFGSASETPVFIFGMPRSGTTLVEQILASHPQVYGAGELKLMAQLVQSYAQQFPSNVGYPNCLHNLDPISSCTLGETYIDNLKNLVKENRSNILRITDKMPGNFIFLGVIALLFPRAKLIHCARDPMSSCFSCFTQRFTSVIVYSRSLQDLGHYYKLYDDLMAHWHNVLPVPILDVQYEDMVTNPEEMSRKIVDFVGLEWNDACLNFHETKRQVKTASVEQVRKPIYTSSLEKWRSYEPFLTPLKEALGR